MKQFPELKDKVVVPVKNKKKRFEDMWNKMSPEARACRGIRLSSDC